MIPLAVILAAISCSRKPEAGAGPGDPLVYAGDSALYREDVLRLIPSGLAPDDSSELFRNIVDRWVETRILEEVARENIVDRERIDRLAEDYRNRLIVDEYLRKMGDIAPAEVASEEITAYYRQYGDSMTLEEPLVKGIFVRTIVKDDALANIRRWMMSAQPADIDELEKKGLKEATGYEYFAERWVEWSELARQLPERVPDADIFLKENRDVEFVSGGTVYLLHVSDYILSGNVMPEDFARQKIVGILADRRQGEYLKNLKLSIYRKAIKEGKLKKGSYDPLIRIP